MNIFTTLPKAQDADKPLLYTVIKYCCSMAEKDWLGRTPFCISQTVTRTGRA